MDPALSRTRILIFFSWGRECRSQTTVPITWSVIVCVCVREREREREGRRHTSALCVIAEIGCQTWLETNYTLAVNGRRLLGVVVWRYCTDVWPIAWHDHTGNSSKEPIRAGQSGPDRTDREHTASGGRTVAFAAETCKKWATKTYRLCIGRAPAHKQWLA